MALTKGTLRPYPGRMWKDWKKIDAAAELLGVSVKTRHKWRQRRAVPQPYRLPIYRLTGIKNFDAPPGFKLRPYTRRAQDARG